MNKILLYIFIIFSFTSFGQELNCNVVVNATQTGDENLQIFKTLIQTGLKTLTLLNKELIAQWS
jgi:hypothetical protein